MQKRLKKRYDARTPQSVSHRAYTRERKRYASTLVLSPHAIVPNCSYLLASSVGIRRVPSRRRSSSNKVAENKKSHVPWRHVRQQRMHRDRWLCSPPGVSDDCSCLPRTRTQRKKRYIRSKDFVACACANLNSVVVACRRSAAEFRCERPRKPFGFEMCWQTHPFLFPSFFPSTF